MTPTLDTFAQVLFWLAAFCLFHVYVGYEALLRLAARLAPVGAHAQPEADHLPTLSILLTVHNEQRQVVARLENLLAQDYPAGRTEIVVASDGSTDETEALVAAFAAAHPERVIRLVPCHPQGGKSAAQNRAVPQLTGEVVVLTDAATRFAPGYLRALAAPFADPGIGCVSGQVVFSDEGTAISRGQGRYWRSEMNVRACESRLGILAVASGQAMAFRRSLFRPLPTHIGDDCVIPLDVVRSGARVFHQPSALAFDANESRSARELSARSRMTARNWAGTWRYPGLLSPLRHPGYTLALWSHKLMRWLSPVFLLVLAASSLWLARHPFYGLCAGGGAAVLALAALGHVSEGRRERSGLPWRAAGMAQAFCVAQLGFLLGLAKVVRGQKIFAYRTGPGAGA